MAGIMDDVYEFLAAPARQRNANEAARTDAMANAPKFSDLAGMKVGQRLAPTPGNPAALFSPVRSNDTPIGMTLGSQPFGPPMAGTEMPSSMDLAAIQKLAMNGPGPIAKPAGGGYAPWGAAGRSAFFNAMNGGLPPNFPIDSDVPLNIQGPPTAPATGREAIMMDPNTLKQIGTSLFSMPMSIRGSSTGREYSTDQFHSTSQYKYAPVIDARTGQSRFLRVGAPDGDTRSSAERYAASVSRQNDGAGGRTSSGQSRTNSDGTSWASRFGDD